MSRYDDREILENAEVAYEDIIKRRGVRKIVHYATPTMTPPTAEDYQDLTMIRHTWVVGDRFYKLSFEHYGTTDYWWVIARFNSTPTESHVKIGDKVNIPLPLDRALEALRVS